MTTRERKLWKKEDDKKLKELLALRDLCIKEIAETLNRTPKSVRRRCDRLSISSSSTYKKKRHVRPLD